MRRGAAEQLRKRIMYESTMIDFQKQNILTPQIL